MKAHCHLAVLIFSLGVSFPAAAVPAPSSVPAAPASLDERIILVAPTGAGNEDREIQNWQTRIRAEPGSAGDYERLGWAYITKARRTLDTGYYKLAEKTADAMDARFGSSPSSLLLRGHVLDNLHRFHEAEAVGRQLVAARGDAYDYALLSDTLMEQGSIPAAVAACQEEMNRRPGLESYARAAHLRWLTGDLPGATAMMEAAVRASSPVDAATCAWVVTRLSGYELQAGAAARALQLADAAARVAPDYPPALLAQGKALLALDRTVDAVAALRQAAALNPLPEYQWWEADALRAAGRMAAADRVDRGLADHGEVSDPRTLALYLATRAEEKSVAGADAAAAAVRLARAELANRADPLTEDALAWALAASGDLRGAAAAMRTALADHTRDARLFLHAGDIALAAGDRIGAQRYLAAARTYAATLTPGEAALLRDQIEAAGRGGLAPGAVAVR
jgi:tetratricopeptide (TPR) repeat protein